MGGAEGQRESVRVGMCRSKWSDPAGCFCSRVYFTCRQKEERWWIHFPGHPGGLSQALGEAPGGLNTILKPSLSAEGCPGSEGLPGSSVRHPEPFLHGHAVPARTHTCPIPHQGSLRAAAALPLAPSQERKPGCGSTAGVSGWEVCVSSGRNTRSRVPCLLQRHKP